jgi:hypothetical protein
MLAMRGLPCLAHGDQAIRALTEGWHEGDSIIGNC